MSFLAALLIALFVVLVILAPFCTWVVMLALGNFGFTQFGFIDCIPAGMIVSMLSPNSSSKKD